MIRGDVGRYCRSGAKCIWLLTPFGLGISSVRVKGTFVSRMPLKLTIHSWNAIGSWHWQTHNQEELCGICRLSFDACCPECRMPGDDCPLIVGECKHCFQYVRLLMHLLSLTAYYQHALPFKVDSITA
jgi:anaphase-promoting complex subunit 11